MANFEKRYLESTDGTPHGNIKKLHELDVIVDTMFADDDDKRAKLKSAIKEAQMSNLYKLMAEYTKKETK